MQLSLPYFSLAFGRPSAGNIYHRNPFERIEGSARGNREHWRRRRGNEKSDTKEIFVPRSEPVTYLFCKKKKKKKYAFCTNKAATLEKETKIVDGSSLRHRPTQLCIAGIKTGGFLCVTCKTIELAVGLVGRRSRSVDLSIP